MHLVEANMIAIFDHAADRRIRTARKTEWSTPCRLTKTATAIIYLSFGA